jgi:hypothetical protein
MFILMREKVYNLRCAPRDSLNTSPPRFQSKRFLNTLPFMLFLAFGLLGLGTVYGQNACPDPPTISLMVFNPSNLALSGTHTIESITLLPSTPGLGLEYRFRLDGGDWQSALTSEFTDIPEGPHCLDISVWTTEPLQCGGTNFNKDVMVSTEVLSVCLFFGEQPTPTIPISSIVGSGFCTKSVNIDPALGPPAPFSCLEYEYSLDGQNWSPSTSFQNLSSGCHELYQIYKCNSPIVYGTPTSSLPQFFVLFDEIKDKNITVNTTCLGSILEVLGLPELPNSFIYEYKLDDEEFLPLDETAPLEPGLHQLFIQQRSDCTGNLVDRVSLPQCSKTLTFIVYPEGVPEFTLPSINEFNSKLF